MVRFSPARVKAFEECAKAKAQDRKQFGLTGVNLDTVMDKAEVEGMYRYIRDVLHKTSLKDIMTYSVLKDVSQVACRFPRPKELGQMSSKSKGKNTYWVTTVELVAVPDSEGSIASVRSRSSIASKSSSSARSSRTSRGGGGKERKERTPEQQAYDMFGHLVHEFDDIAQEHDSIIYMWLAPSGGAFERQLRIYSTRLLVDDDVMPIIDRAKRLGLDVLQKTQRNGKPLPVYKSTMRKMMGDLDWGTPQVWDPIANQKALESGYVR